MTFDINSVAAVDHYAMTIEDDIDGRSLISKSETERLADLAKHLSDVPQNLVERVYERVKSDGKLPEMAQLIDDGFRFEADRVLDAVSHNWKGENVAELSRELELLHTDTSDLEVIALSRSMMKQESVDGRERYIEALATRMGTPAGVSEKFSLFPSKSVPDAVGTSVANVWGSLKDNPAAFQRVGESINTTNAVVASVNKVQEKSLVGGVQVSYDNETLSNLLQGATQITNESLKQKIFDSSTQAVATRSIPPGALEAGLQTLRDSLADPRRR